VKRSTHSSLTALRPLLLLLVASVLIIALLPGSGLLAAASHVFQSPGDPGSDSPLPTPTPMPPTPTPQPPTDTPLPPPTATPEPPTATPEGEPLTPTDEPAPPTVEVPADTPTPQEPAAPAESTPTQVTQPADEPSPTPETVHLPVVESDSEPQQPVQGQPETEEPSAPVEPEQPSEALAAPQEAEQSGQNSTARFIDGLVVLFSYGWLACGVLLLLAIPLAIFLLPRWGRRRGQV